MNRIGMRIAFGSICVTLVTLAPAGAQTADSPVTRLRPIDAPSAVDQYLGAKRWSVSRETTPPIATSTPGGTAQSDVRQVVWQQPTFGAPALPQGGGFQLPPGGGVPPAGSNTPPPVTMTPPPGQAPPPMPTPRALPSNPNSFPAAPPSSSDLVPLSQPQLASDYANVGNCSCVSPPSTYTARSGGGCGAPIAYATNETYVAPPTFVAPPAEIAAPVVLPPVTVADAAPVRPLFSFGQNRNPVQLGQGIVGQPVAYVPGQRFRNWLRYMFP